MANQRAQVTMTEAEIQEFLEESRVATLATNGPSGYPHQVAMWYGIVDGQVCFETHPKSQKAVNLRRDPKISISVMPSSWRRSVPPTIPAKSPLLSSSRRLSAICACGTPDAAVNGRYGALI